MKTAQGFTTFIWTTTATVEADMNETQQKPVTVGEILIEEFIEPMSLTQGQVAEAMGVSRRTVNEICTNRRAVTVDTALMLSKVFGTSAEFWLNTQQRNDLWAALNTPKRRERIERARSIN